MTVLHGTIEQNAYNQFLIRQNISYFLRGDLLACQRSGNYN
jgi:hypothetical protein